MPQAELERLFNPSAIAVVGASSEPGSLGGQPLAALCANGYRGTLYPVNRARSEILGLPAFGSLGEVPGPVDVAVVAVRAAAVREVVAECGRLRIPFALLLSSGFAELGDEGARLQAEVAETARAAGVRLVGPNSLGIYNVASSMPAGFGMGIAGRSVAPPGPAAIVSQSGGMAMALVSRGIAVGLGFSRIASTGNEADLTALDFVAHALEDPDTRIVLAVLEACRQAERLPALARRAAQLGKPIVVAKMGSTESGRRASRSHTGSLTGSDRAFDAAFRQLGIPRVDDLDEMIELAIFLLRGRLPTGSRAAVLTQSGGGGGWLAECVEREGISVPETSPALRAELEPLVPPFGALGNPIDVTASGIGADTFLASIQVLERSREFDSIALVLPLLDPALGAPNGLLEQIARVTWKPVLGFSHWVPDPELRARLAGLGIPYSLSPKRAARVLALATAYAERRRRPPPAPPAPITTPAPVSPETWYPALNAAGLPVARTWFCRTAAEAAGAARSVSGRLALKVVEPGLLHKSDSGGVRLDVERATVGKVFAELIDRPRAEAVLVQEMAAPGIEIMVGARVDADLGPLVMVGAGGLEAEELDDVAIRLAPIDRAEALRMLDEVAAARRLRAGRGRTDADRESLAAVIERVSAAALAWRGAVAELDLNPVIVNAGGATIVDVAVVEAGPP